MSMETNDWRALSQHYIHDIIKRSLDGQQIDTKFAPTLLIAVTDDALAPARVLRAELRSRMGVSSLPVLTHALQLYDDSNPYNEHVKPWEGSFSAQRILLVDKADSSRVSLASFLQEVQNAIAQQQQASQGDAAWQQPEIGVYVLHNKRRTKEAELPAELLNGRYFVGEESEDVHIAYPFNLQHNSQPTAHGEHASGAAAPARKSLEHPPRRPSPPPSIAAPGGVLRAVSTRYVENILERAVVEQQLVERFGPTMLVVASDDALPVARQLRDFLVFKAHGAVVHGTSEATPHHHDLPVLTPRLELYDDESNPYLAHILGVKDWGAASLAGRKVLVVDKADMSRSTLASFISQLQAAAAAARQECEATGCTWAGDPVFGVFVLHNKKVDKVDLPEDILANRYFYGEEIENVRLHYPFNFS